MNWSMGDFLVAGFLLLILTLSAAYLLFGRGALSFRIGFALSLATAAILVWVTGAVGLIGSAQNDANLAYPGLVVLATLGAVTVRFQAKRMALIATGLALGQSVIGLVALIAGWGREGASWPYDILAATIGFSVLWLAAAFCFRYASKPR